MAAEDDDETFTRAARNVLFRKPPVIGEVTERTSAAADPERHLRVKVTMNLDGDVVSYFKNLSKSLGRPYQVLINEALRTVLDGERSTHVLETIKSALLSDETFLDELRRKVKIS